MDSLVIKLSHVPLFATPWTAAHKAPLSMGFSRQEYWSGVPSPSPLFQMRRLKVNRKVSLLLRASLIAQLVKNPPASAGDAGSVPGLGRSPGGGHGNPLQYSCLENPMDRGALWVTVHGVAKSQT